MPLWGNTDSAAQSAIFVPAQLKKAPTAANRNALYGNTTGNAYFTNETIGTYGVSHSEMRATRADKEPRPAHAGWVLRHEGQGNRAGRVWYEVMVAGDLSGDTENTVFQDYAIVINTQPTDATGNSTADDIVTFTVGAATVPPGMEANIVYQWQIANGGNTSDFIDLSDAGAYSNTDTDTLSVLANTANTDEIYRCELTGFGGANDYTNYVTITIT